jgi:hypothetical protein
MPRNQRSIEGRECHLSEIDIAAVRVVADDAAAIADRDRLQLTGGEAVLLDLIDLHVAVGVGELRDATRAEIHADGTDIDTVDDHVVQIERGDDRVHLAVRQEGEILIGVLPG